MNIYCKKFIFLIFIFLLSGRFISAQPCTNPSTSNCADAISGGSEFIMSTSGNVDFEFDDMSKFINGITHSGSTRLRLKVDELVSGQCKWKLIMYIDNNGTTPDNEWETLTTYGTTGDKPQLDLIQVKVYNGCGTPVANGIFQIFSNNVQYDILDIIPDQSTQHNPAPCDGTHVNGPGSYLTDYNEYNFTIDYRILPGYSLQSGAYQIKIHFCLVEVS